MVKVDDDDLPTTRSLPIDDGLPAVLRPPTTPVWRPMVPVHAIGTRPDLSSEDVIGLVPENGSCPQSGDGWVGGELFPGASVPPEPPLSGKFCVYHREVEGEGDPSALPSYCPYQNFKGRPCVGMPPESWLEPAPSGIVSLGGLSDTGRQAVAEALRESFRAQIGLPDSLPGVSSFMHDVPALPDTTRLVVLDDGGEHSKAVLQTALASACFGPSCAVEATAINVFDGQAGASAVSVAKKLFDKVREAQTSGVKKLVFNASFGIHPAMMAEAGSSAENRPMYLGYEALKAAINHAACSGYLFVSAIGNRDGGDDDRDAGEFNAMFPGGWSHDKQTWSCDKAAPIVVAAGAVNADGTDSMTTRVNGQAELVTPGFAVPLDAVGAGKLYWEGSSFSSAALSGVMAVVWSYLPHVDARTIIDLVHDNAQPLPGRRTALCRTGDDCEVRRVRLCETVQAALFQARFGAELLMNPAATMRCATARESAPWTRVELDQRARSTLGGTSPLTWTEVDPLPSTPDCGAPAHAAAELARAPYSCPFEILGNAQSRRDKPGNQPGTNGCPLCSVSLLADDDLHFIGKFDASYLPIISSPVLHVRQVTTVKMPLSDDPKKPMFRLGTALIADAVDERYYELSGLLDTATDETNVALDLAVNDDTKNLEVMLEYVVHEPGQEPRAVGVPIPLLDFRPE
jgi:hypothetical protein